MITVLSEILLGVLGDVCIGECGDSGLSIPQKLVALCVPVAVVDFEASQPFHRVIFAFFDMREKDHAVVDVDRVDQFR